MATAVDLFGGNSDGGMRMERWLDRMCRGCKRDRGRAALGGGGASCGLPVRALLDPYDANMPEWSSDAAPLPQRIAELGAGPWPVCMAYEPRKQRSDAGTTRAMPGQEALL